MPPTDSPRIEGYVENLSAQRVTGWAWEVGSDRALVLQVLLGDRLLGEAVADRFRKDLLDGKKGSGKHAFEFVFPAPVTDFWRPGHIRVRVRGAATPLTMLEALVKRLATLAAEAPATPPPRPSRPPAPPPPPPPSPAPLPAVLPEELVVEDLPAAPQTEIYPPALPAAREAAPPPIPPPAATARPTLIVTATHDYQISPRAAWLATLRTHTAGAGPTTILALGGKTRPPLSSPGIHLHHVPECHPAALVAAAIAAADSHPGAALIVSPPSFHAMAAGALIARLLGAKLIADLEDADLPPVPPAALDAAPLAAALAGPAEPLAAFLPALSAEADFCLVANPAMRRRHGGMLVRQGRDQTIFDPAGYARRQLRAAFGYTEADRIVLLHGPLTQQDGVLEIAEALERIADPRLALCLVGAIADPKIQQRLAACTGARIAIQAPPPATRVPALIAMADCVAVLQSASQKLTQWRIPARLIDALAMNVPVIATPAPPLQDLAAAGAVQLVADATQLDAALRAVAESPDPADRPPRTHAVYLAEFSTQVNAVRLDLALHAAAAAAAGEKPNTLALFRALQTHLPARLPFMVPEPQPAPPPAGRAPLPRAAHLRDLVFLASDNASDLFGRRPDRIATHLLAAGKVARILHFDARISAAELELLAAGSGPEAHRGSLIYANTVRRVLGLADTPSFLRRTFLHRSGRKTERMMGRELPAAADYLDFIRRILSETAIGPAPLLWVSGHVADAAAIRQAIDPALTIADLPTPAGPPDEAPPIEADLVLAADEATQAHWAPAHPDIRLLPNPPDDLADDAAAPWWNEQIARIWQWIERTD